MDCKQKSCSLFKTCKKFHTRIHNKKDKHTNEVDILFVYSSASEDDKKQIRENNAGKIFRNILIGNVFKNKKSSFAITSLLRTSASNRVLPKDWELCHKNFEADLKSISPKTIITLGTQAYSRLASSSGFTDVGEHEFRTERLYGRKLKLAGKKYPVLPTYSPYQAVNKQTTDGAAATFSLILSDIKRAFFNPQLISYNTEGNTVKVLKTIKSVKKFVQMALGGDHKTIVCDTETKNLNRKFGNILSLIQFSTEEDIAHIIPYAHPETPFTPGEQKEIRILMRKLFLTKKALFNNWLFANSVFDLHQINREFGVHPFGIKKKVIDVLLAAHALNENRKEAKEELIDGYFDLKSLSREYLFFRGYDNEELLSKRSRGLLHDMSLDDPDLIRYAADDVFTPRMLMREFLKHAELSDYKEKLLSFLYGYIDQASRLITSIEINGLPLDYEQIRKLASSKSPIKTHIRDIEEEIKKNKYFIKANKKILNLSSTGMKTSLYKDPWVFSLSKSEHLKTIFFDVLHLAPVNKSKKTGQPSVDKTFQEEYKDSIREVKLFSDWQSANTLVKMFIKPMSLQTSKATRTVDFSDGRVRSRYWLTGTVTGRLSSSDPNLQFLPSGKETFAKETKSSFKARKGYKFIEADYSASEVRWLCNMAVDKNYAAKFLEAFKAIDRYRKNPTKKNKAKMLSHGDPHKHTASIMFNVRVEKVTPDQRKASKAITFGLIYGMHVYTLAKNLGMSVEKTEALVEIFFGLFPDSRKYLYRVEAFGENHGYVESPIFRRRNILAILFEGDRRRVSDSKRLARNAPIQGISSDCSLLGASLLSRYIYKNDLDWKISNLVHDSIWAEVPDKDISKFIVKTEYFCTTGVQKYIEKKFETKMICPLAVDFKIGSRLGYMKDLDFKHFVDNKLNLSEYP